MTSSRSIVASIVGAAAVGTLLAPNLAGAAANKVRVVNTPTQAVPVAPQGVTEVAVTNRQLPVTQNGLWSVGVDPANNDVVVANASSNPVPVSSTPAIPVAESGEWVSAGLNLPPMILHDLTFYNDDPSGTCRFSMAWVIDNTNSRTFEEFTLGLDESVDLHYEAGVDTAHLRFGTISSTDPECIRNWVAMGYAVP